MFSGLAERIRQEYLYDETREGQKVLDFTCFVVFLKIRNKNNQARICPGSFPALPPVFPVSGLRQTTWDTEVTGNRSPSLGVSTRKTGKLFQMARPVYSNYLTSMIGILKNFLSIEMTGWKLVDVVWLSIATSVILWLSVFWQDTWTSLLAALSGVLCVVLTGMGKRSSFIFGMTNTVLYAIVAFQAKYYGEVMLNVLYYIPMNFVGWFVWKKYMNAKTGEVVKKKLNFKKSLVVYAATAAAIFGYGLVLQMLGGKLPYIDSMTTVVSVVAQILSIKRLTEQWILWIAVDVATIFMWAVHFAQGGESIATLAMWSVYLINAFIMYIRWNKEAKNNEI